MVKPCEGRSVRVCNVYYVSRRLFHDPKVSTSVRTAGVGATTARRLCRGAAALAVRHVLEEVERRHDGRPSQGLWSLKTPPSVLGIPRLHNRPGWAIKGAGLVLVCSARPHPRRQVRSRCRRAARDAKAADPKTRREPMALWEGRGVVIMLWLLREQHIRRRRRVKEEACEVYVVEAAQTFVERPILLGTRFEIPGVGRGLKSVPTVDRFYSGPAF